MKIKRLSHNGEDPSIHDDGIYDLDEQCYMEKNKYCKSNPLIFFAIIILLIMFKF